MEDRDRKQHVSGWNTIYEALLRFYPAEIRNRTARDMMETFDDMALAELRSRGRIGLVAFLARAYAEVPIKALAARLPLRGKSKGTRSAPGGNSDAGRSVRTGGPLRLLDTVVQDIRFALRTLHNRPIYTAVTIATLGLGIGAATAMFSVVDAVLIKGLQYRDHGRLVTVWQVVPSWQNVVNLTDYWDKGWLSFAQYRAWIEAGNSSLDIAIHDDHGMTLTGSGDPERLAVGEASASLLRVLGVSPLMGRWFLSDEEGTESRQSSAVVVLSHELWQRRFGGDPDVLGTTLTSSEQAYTIIGVLPPRFRLRMLTVHGDDGERDVWVPAEADNGYHWEAIGRLAPEVTLEQARAVAGSILLPDVAASRMSIRLIPRKESEILGLKSPLVLLLGATGLLLCIACANIVALSLAEVLGRRHEIATRFALGANKHRIVRQLATESLVLGIAGSIAGAVIAVLGTRLVALLAPPIPRIDEVVVDIRVLGFAITLGAFVGLVFGTVPPLVSARDTLGDTVRGSGTARPRRGQSFTRAVIAAEVSLTVLLLVASGLFARSLVTLFSVDAGFDSKNVVGIHLLPPVSLDDAPTAEMTFYYDVLDRIRTTPGVVEAAMSNGIPFIDGTSSFQVKTGSPDGGPGFSVSALGYGISPGYFEVMGMPLYVGRSFSRSDGSHTLPVTVVNQSLARRCWPDRDPIGVQFEYYEHDTLTVIGVVGDVRHEALDRDPVLTFYVPFIQQPWYGEADFVARTDENARHVLPALRSAVWSVDADVPITMSGTLESFIAQSATIERYRTLLIAVFGICATVLAAVGVFGVTARGVAQKTREMGIRMSLGATESGLVRSTVLYSLFTGLAGIAVGLIGALWTSRLLSRFLFGIEPNDPLTYGAVTVSAVCVCLLASLVPARRILKLNPVEVLRAE